jgi:hypothetical protein
MILTELNAGLENVLNNVVFGLLLTRLVAPEAWASVDPPIATFRGSKGDLLRLDVGPMCSQMANTEYKRALTEEYENCLKRATVREGHELLLLYCEETHQFDIYKSQPWFQFARIIRNVVSHKDAGVLREWPRDLKKSGVSQVTWRHYVLDESMVGSAITFTLYDALLLLKDKIEFARTKLA